MNKRTGPSLLPKTRVRLLKTRQLGFIFKKVNDLFKFYDSK